MRRLKNLMPKDHVGIEGRTIDIQNLKVHVYNKIAEGGFSCVYLARDVNHPTKHYALKHIICNDVESLDLVLKETWAMQLLRGHSNVVPLFAHTILDTGRTKEALLVMECCDKSLFNVLESRGGGYFDEKQVLLIFRDVCNAVFAMHSQSPPIAHRDLKAENILKGTDGMWKLCDFGSISINHQRFERPEEMGIEEDNIRKHTTPAYRAPEMWDLFRKELINEKVDIWALGCLLYRICYFKSAFDGESKLQILNGNYRIPEVPKYSSTVTDLLRDMLQASPDARPDITQVWFRVNERLPIEWQKLLPDRTAEIHDGGASSAARKSLPMPRRDPHPPPSKEQVPNLSQSVPTYDGGGQLGVFWSTQHAVIANVAADTERTVLDERANGQNALKNGRRSTDNRPHLENHIIPREQNARNTHASSVSKVDYGTPKDNELRLFADSAAPESGKPNASQPEKAGTSHNGASTFVAEFDKGKRQTVHSKLTKESALQAEVNKLKDQLKQVNLEKTEITAKYEKLCTVCRSQRQEIQGLKQAVSAQTKPGTDHLKNQKPSGSLQSVAPPPKEKIEGTVWELEQGFFTTCSPNPGSRQWQTFADEPQPESPLAGNTTSSLSTNGYQNRWETNFNSGPDNWGFDTDSFTAGSAASVGAQISRTSIQGNNSQRFASVGSLASASTQISRSASQGNISQLFGNTRNVESNQASQPAGWAGF